MRVVPNWDKYIELEEDEELRNILIECKKQEERLLEIEKLPGGMVMDDTLRMKEKQLQKRLKELERLMGIK